MSPSKKGRTDRFSSALKITVILFLCVVVCRASPVRDKAGKVPARAKGVSSSVALTDAPGANKSAVRPAVSRLDSDSSHIAKTGALRGDTAAPKPAADSAHAANLLDSATATKSSHRTDKAMAKVVRTARTDTSGRSTRKEVRFWQQPSVSAPNRQAGFPDTMIARILVLLMLAAVIVVFTFVVSRAVRKKIGAKRFLTTTRLSVMDKEVQRTCRYIEKNFMDPNLSVESVCKALVTGKAFVESLMERDLGIGVSSFIAHVRINRARMILDNDPSVSKESVARETGFADVSSFCESFKKIAGASFDAYCQSGRSGKLTLPKGMAPSE
jgi:AraC-like DNA-binding protein